MKKILLIIFSSFLLGGCTIQNPLHKKPSGLEITTTPSSTVYLNDEQVGSTPYSQTDLTPGNYQVRLVPVSGQNLAPWETQLTLKSEVTTIINKTFSPAETDSSSYILELQPEPGEGTYISVISDPDNINLTIDGKPSGYTPIAKLASTPGAHQLSFSSPGYKPLELPVNTTKGYNLIVNIKLASDLILLTDPEPASSSSNTPPSEAETSTQVLSSPEDEGAYVVIQETGTGWLRVRNKPSSSGEELGKVDVGEKLSYLDDISETGWYKVEFEGEVGWLSAKYATLIK